MKMLANLALRILGLKRAEAFGSEILSQYHEAIFQRDWVRQENGSPHFFPRKNTLHRLYSGELGSDTYSLLRGLYGLELIRPGETVLDIGCGDGGLTKRFLAIAANHVDAVDIEPTAITAAVAENSASNIEYHLLDAVNGKWPRERYDAICLDGALGHFSTGDTEILLKKVSESIGGNGIFFGSESLLEADGHDHLQTFHTTDDLCRLMKEHFRFAKVTEKEYSIRGGLLRREAFFRASNSSERVEAN